MANLWVTSDTHFGHHNIIDFGKRPFANAKEMNETLLENWNSTVDDDDIVWHLGDVYFGGGFGRDYWVDFIGKLKGKKRLIVGNHDKLSDPILYNNFKYMSMWEVLQDMKLLLTHVPIHPRELDHPHSRKRQGVINVHGHTHLNAEPDDSGRYKCVCVELTDYKPVAIEELVRLHDK